MTNTCCQGQPVQGNPIQQQTKHAREFMIHSIEKSKADWDAFRALEAKRHREFFLPIYPKIGMTVVQDIFDDTKTNMYDVIVEYWGGRRFKIDEKARNGEYNDFAVEVMQCLKVGRIGWLYDPVDYIFYASWKTPEETQPSSAYLIKLPNLRELVANDFNKLQSIISTKGYGITLMKKVAWHDLEYLKITQKIV